MRLLFLAAFMAGVLLICLKAPAAAQPPPETLALRGKVTDRQTGAAIAAARIVLKPLPTPGFERQAWLNIEKSTDQTGAFVVEKVDEGDYELNVLARGYNRFMQPRISVRSSQPAVLNVPLDRRTEPVFPLQRPQDFFGEFGLRLPDLPDDLREELQRLAGFIFRDENGRVRVPRFMDFLPPEAAPGTPSTGGQGLGGLGGARSFPRGGNAAYQPNRQPMRPNDPNRPMIFYNPPLTTNRPSGKFFEIISDQRADIIRLQEGDVVQIQARTQVAVQSSKGTQQKQTHLSGNVIISLLRGTKTVVQIQAPRATVFEEAQRVIVDVRTQS